MQRLQIQQEISTANKHKNCIKIETSLSYHKENILCLANSMSPNLHTFLCKQYHRHCQMHSAATMKKVDGMQLNCYVLFSEWVGFGHISTKKHLFCANVFRHKHVQGIISKKSFCHHVFPFAHQLLDFSVEWQNKAMQCSQQGYFHSGISFRVATWYSSTIKTIKIKN